MTTEQYRLDITNQMPYRADLFHVAEANVAAWRLIEAWPDWSHPVMCIVGPKGAGKTHLARIWCEAAKAAWIDGTRLREDSVGELRAHVRFVVDDADKSPDQTALFHLYNHVMNAEGSLLLTAESHPAEWPIDLPDLRTRINAVPVVPIGVPDDDLFDAILKKLFRDRQIEIPENVVSYLTKRIERSYGTAQAVVDNLDREVWTKGQPITLSTARALLGELVSENEEAAEPDRV